MRELFIPQSSPLHRLDGRVKLLLSLIFIVCLNLSPDSAWGEFILFFSILLAAAILARVGAGTLLKRSLIALPFLLAAAPLIFTGPPPLTVLQFAAGLRVPISAAGLARFAAIGIKSWLSVQAAVLLAATTRVPDLLTALLRLKIPVIFVSIARLMWRYLFVIVEEAERLLRARASRSAAPAGGRGGGSWLWHARVTGGMAGNLFLRALERSDRVYAAMLARGYDGHLPSGQATALSKKDLSWLLAGALGALCLLALGLWSGG